jgi:trimeric autotransporter adhesin
MRESIRFWIFICALLSGSHGAHTTITDVDWTGLGQSNMFQRHIFPYNMVGPSIVHAVDRNGNLYLSPHNQLNAGGLWITAIAKWDHQNWSDVGIGIDGTLIHTLAFDSAGNLYAGGEFDTIKGIPVNNIIKWDGTAWSSVGSGVNDGYVGALTIDGNGNIYAALTSDGGSPYSIIKWDGTAWSTLGTLHGGINSLAIDNKGNLYAYGWFDTVNTVIAHNIAKWDGKSWSALGAGLRGSESSYFSDAYNMRFNGKDLYVIGTFDSAGSVAAQNIAKWDGNSWSTVGNQTFLGVSNLETDSLGNIYLCGTTFPDKTNVAKWDGTTWTFLDDGRNIYPGNLMVDRPGNAYVETGTQCGLTLWRNNSWSPLCIKNGLDGPVNVFAYHSTTGNLYVGGEFITAGNTIVDGLALWRDNSWNLVEGNPLKGVQNNWGIRALVFDNHGILYAAGASSTTSSIAKFNGDALTTISDLDNLYAASRTYALAADSIGNLYAGGEFDTINKVAARKIAKWDGAAWSPLGEGITGNDVRALVFDKQGNLYAAGDFDKAGSVVAHNIAKWDGVAWSPLGQGILQDPDNFCPVSALAIDDNGYLYAGGDFNFAGGIEAHSIAKWDGAAWSALGQGLRMENSDLGYRSKVYSLTIGSDGTLYAGGEFTIAGEVKASNIAKWDGAAWSALGSGISASIANGYGFGCVSALVDNKKGTLYVGGDFCIAGGKTSVGFAQCNIGSTKAEYSGEEKAQRPVLSYESKKGLVRMHCITAAEAGLSIYTVSGRNVYHASKLMTPGDHEIRIQTTGLARGAYIAQVKSGRESLRCRVIISQ